jgi:hypothetical protein
MVFKSFFVVSTRPRLVHFLGSQSTANSSHFYISFRRKKQCVFYVDIVKQNVYRISIRWAKICVPRADMAIRNETNVLSGGGDS